MLAVVIAAILLINIITELRQLFSTFKGGIQLSYCVCVHLIVDIK